MKYGYFDSEKKEYVITRPDTPSPWANYLGSPLYGAIISNNAGGYSFVESGAKGRILRYRFNYDDKPGRYIYLRDDSSEDYWSASWQPVGKTMDYLNTCRHGLGYTIIETRYSEIDSKVTYYVPLNKTYEIWKLKVRNTSNKERKISIFGYAEFTNDSDYQQDTVNLQYSQFISRTYFKENKIIQKISENTENSSTRFLGLFGSPISSYCGDRRSFIGNYSSYANPKAVIEGQCDNSLNYNLNSCGALHTSINLKPSEEKEILFILGEHDEVDAEKIISSYTIEKTTLELAELKNYWEGILGGFKVQTPDENFNNMINVWNAYQCFISFTWSRAASFIYCGHRNGFGYRDTVQDIQGVIHLVPKLAKKQLIFMLSAQVNNGAGLPLVKYDHTPGEEKSSGTLYRSDDALWLFPTINKYIGETGDVEFLDEIIAYANKGEDTVYNHLKKAISFSMNNLGINGLPAGLYADWNDCLRLGQKGESSFVAMQLFLALNILEGLARFKDDWDYLNYLIEWKASLSNKIEEFFFEEDRYIRGITEDKQLIGSKNNEEANLWLNPQSWAVISGLSDKNTSEIILDNVYDNLNTPYGARLLSPPFKDKGLKSTLSTVYNASTKENGGIFLHTQGWLILAEALMGNGNRAFEYYKKSSPAHQNHIPEIREMEPYVYGQFTESVESPHEGRSHVHWLTGTASTVMVGSVEGILGIRPDINGILLKPAIPSHWKEVKIEKNFRGKKLVINIENFKQKTNGYRQIYLNKERIDSNYIEENQLSEYNEILYIM